MMIRLRAALVTRAHCPQTGSIFNKKLSYRRETARQLRWLANRSYNSLNNYSAAVVQLHVYTEWSKKRYPCFIFGPPGRPAKWVSVYCPTYVVGEAF